MALKQNHQSQTIASTRRNENYAIWCQIQPATQYETGYWETSFIPCFPNKEYATNLNWSVKIRFLNKKSAAHKELLFRKKFAPE